MNLPEPFDVDAAAASDREQLRELVSLRISSPTRAEKVMRAVAGFTPPSGSKLERFRVAPRPSIFKIFGGQPYLWKVTAVLEGGLEIRNVEWSRAQREACERGKPPLR